MTHMSLSLSILFVVAMTQPSVVLLLLYPDFKPQSRATSTSKKGATGFFHVHVVFSNADSPVNYGYRDPYRVQVIRAFTICMSVSRVSM